MPNLVSQIPKPYNPKLPIWQSYTQGWIYPDTSTSGVANAMTEITTIKAHTLKPEYFRVDLNGDLQRLDVSGNNNINGYSTANVTAIKANSREQYVTVAGALPPGIGFNPNSVSNWLAFIRDNAKKANGITTLVNFCVTNGFTGVEIDFEPLNKSRRDGQGTPGLRGRTILYQDYLDFLDWMKQLADALHTQGKKLIVDIFTYFDYQINTDPGGDTTMIDQTTNNKPGGIYPFAEFDLASSQNTWAKGSDFVAIGVDYICYMAYDYQYSYGSGNNIQPTRWLRTMLDTALNEVADRDKIIIGLPAYGYYGPLTSQAGAEYYRSYVGQIKTKGEMLARPNSNTAKRNSGTRQVVELGSRQTPYLIEGGFEMEWTNPLPDNKIEYNCYNDSTSMNLKRELIESYGIKRVAVWHVGGNDWFTGKIEPN